MRGLIAVALLAFTVPACGSGVGALAGDGALAAGQHKVTSSATSTAYPTDTPSAEPTATASTPTGSPSQTEAAASAPAAETAAAPGADDASGGGSDETTGGGSEEATVDPRIPNVGRFEPASKVEQAVVVKGTSWSSTVVTVETWERAGSSSPWTLLGTGGGRVGYSGMKVTRVEGDGSTPAGMFRILWGFGTGGNPNPNGMTWRTFNDDDYWVGDSEHAPTYNTYQTSRTSGWDTADAEWLWSFRTLYEYAWVIDFNRPRYGTRPASEPQPILSGPGSGNAIFLHVQGSGATAGCVSVPLSRIQSISRWLDAAKNPVIIIGEDGWLAG